MTINLTTPKCGRHPPTDIDRHVGAMLRRRRIMLDLTQRALGAQVGLSHQEIHKYETGIDRIYAGQLHVLAFALGCRVDDFYEGLENGVRWPPPPLSLERKTLKLLRDVAALPEDAQAAVCDLARKLAGESAGDA